MYLRQWQRGQYACDRCAALHGAVDHRHGLGIVKHVAEAGFPQQRVAVIAVEPRWQRRLRGQGRLRLGCRVRLRWWLALCIVSQCTNLWSRAWWALCCRGREHNGQKLMPLHLGTKHACCMGLVNGGLTGSHAKHLRG